MPAELLLATVQAESGLNPRAARYGVWPDVSFGYGQQTVETAGGYGIGDSTNTPDNIANVRATLFARAVSLDLTARILAECLAVANGDWLLALRRYNGGGYGLTADYAERYASHIATYQRALDWAQQALGRA